MEYEYMMWLIESIDPRNIIGDYYQPVLEELYLRDFKWTSKFPDDENRAKDGLELRNQFADIANIPVSEIGIDWKPCSCLEMLVAIAHRIEYEIVAVPGEENVARWFWMFMHNIGLDPSDSGVEDLNYVDYRIDMWLDRKYKKNGEGGIFEIRDDYFDMRKMSIWKQMNAVLNENYDADY